MNSCDNSSSFIASIPSHIINKIQDIINAVLNNNRHRRKIFCIIKHLIDHYYKITRHDNNPLSTMSYANITIKNNNIEFKLTVHVIKNFLTTLIIDNNFLMHK